MTGAGGTGARGRFPGFQDLMRHRINDILLVASPYDAFVLEESGELGERLQGEFRNLDLHYAPGLTAAATGEEALALARDPGRFDLIVTTPSLVDVDAAELARRLRAQGVEAPIVLLAWDSAEVRELAARDDLAAIERAFVWLGDARLLVAIVKTVEDRANAAHDVGAVGVQVILLVEDSLRNYSAFLPVIYGELLRLSRRLVEEDANLSQKILRMRARPKILLATSAEEAEALFAEFHDDVLGVVSDVEFPRGGTKQPLAGLELARMVRERHPDIPIILHSSHPENAALAASVGAAFLQKGAPTVLAELTRILLDDFGFGDFVFRLPDGTAVGRARNLRELEASLGSVPEASIAYHAARNHFSRWLKARTEFALAGALRPRRPADYPDVAALRSDLVRQIADYREDRAARVVADFDRAAAAAPTGLARTGGGSLGGKARGLAFVRRWLAESGLARRYPGIRLTVPTALVVATDVFDRFLDENDLGRFAIESDDEGEIERRFEAAPLPADTMADLSAYLERARTPLAVRSSSLLEDSHHLPFAGVYDTLMLPNDADDLAPRLAAVASAIRRVYASTFTRRAKGYLAATPYRIEEEKMAVVVQGVAGERHGDLFYPDLSAVARSHDYYPAAPARPEDGIAAVVFGLGRAIAEGGACVRFCPRYPRLAVAQSTPRELVETSARGFWALPLGEAAGTAGMREVWCELDRAERDGTLAAVASTYSRENDAIYDGLSRPGVRLVTLAPLLKPGRVPLGELLADLLAEGSRGMGSAVEIELALTLPRPGGAAGTTAELALLQMRPIARAREPVAEADTEAGPTRPLCVSERILGHGVIAGVRDVVVVDRRRFERGRSREAAAEIGRLNARLAAARRPYLLIGCGRWGSRDPWLGIPVSWDQVSGASAIIETSLRDVPLAPSQGSHFFHNLSAFGVGFLTVDEGPGESFLDWDWLDAVPERSASAHVRHLEVEPPLSIELDGRAGRGIVRRPE